MLKVLDCNNFWSPSGGGVRRYHLERMEYYKARTDVDYVFIMHDSRSYTEQIGPTAYIEHLKVPKVMGNWEYRYLVRKAPIEPLIVKHQPDIIEVGSPYIMPKIIHRIVKKHRLKAKLFGFWHADYPVTYVKRFLASTPFAFSGEQIAWKHARKHYNRMEGVLVASEVIRERMIKNGIKNTHFTPLGVNKDLFHPNRKDEGLRHKLKAGDDERLILFFPHRFSKEKGLHILMEAYEKLVVKLDVEPTLILAGTGPYQNLAEAGASKHEHVHFVGFINGKEQMAAYYASADLGFALSSWETFGLSLIEAMSSGLPLIAADDGAAMEHIQASSAGFILPEVSVDHLVEAIVKFQNLTDKKTMKQAARTYAEKLSWENCFDKQLDIYQKSVQPNN